MSRNKDRISIDGGESLKQNPFENLDISQIVIGFMIDDKKRNLIIMNFVF